MVYRLLDALTPCHARRAEVSAEMTTTAMDTTPLLQFLVEQRGFHSGAVVAAAVVVCPSFAPAWQSRHISPSQVQVNNPTRHRGGGWKTGRLAQATPGFAGQDDVPSLFDRAFQLSQYSAAERPF
jgi:hypothetical protein